jgi:predicted aldo/keto reductase-like oxidoreductase
MKFRGGGPIPADPEDEERLAAGFLARGCTPDQAMLKALWQHPAIATVCASMNDFGTLKEYVAAALDPSPLAAGDRESLRAHAEATRATFCRACGACEAACRGAPVADAMRCLMYEAAYGNVHRAREAFAAIPAEARARLAARDWTGAERACPHRLPIGRLVAEARERFGS